MNDIEEILSKYEKSVINNINMPNLTKIVEFLKQENCNFIEEIIEDYLDILTFDYAEFVEKYHKLNEKYNNNLLEEVSNDMNILEEFYLV